MYVPSAYQETRRDVLLRAIAARSFGTLITAGAGGIQTSHIPFGVVEDNDHVCLIGHVARQNPQWRDLGDAEAVASFLVDDAYISPSWYPSKSETGKMVPTWNYVAVEARGRLELVETGPELLDLIDRLTHRHERDRTAPWSTADAPPAFTEALLRGIVGIRLHVRELGGAWKLDQKKRQVDRVGAARSVAAEAGGQPIASHMVRTLDDDRND